MTATATLTSYSKESPIERIYRTVGESLAQAVRDQPKEWSTDHRKTAIACIRHLTYGTDSQESQRHTIAGKVRYIHLNQEQSDLLISWYIEALWDEPATL